MGEVEMGSALKRMLKSLCCSNGWSYGVVWSFDKRNSMLLTLEDAYCEEQMATVVGNMLLQVHMLGEGIIGEVAISGKHKWMFSDTHGGEWNSIAESQDVFQDGSEFPCQFSYGIQTIAVVPVESQGVVQFGSTRKMLENLEFLDQTRRLFQEMEDFDGLIQLENTMLASLNSETYDLNAIFAALTSPESSFTENLSPALGGNSREPMGNPCSVADLSQSSTFASDINNGRISHFDINSSHCYNQSQTAGQEAQVLSSYNPDAQCQQELSQSTCSVKNSGANSSSISTWRDEGSILTSFEQPFQSESVIQESMFTSMYSIEGLVDKEKSFPVSSGEIMDNQQSAQLLLESEELPMVANNLHRLTEEFKLSDFATDLSSSFTVDDMSQLFTPPDHSFHQMATAITNNLLQPGSVPVSSAMVGGNFSIDNPIKRPRNSAQNSITDAFIANGQAEFDIGHGAENDLFYGLGLDSGCARAGGCWEDFTTPAESGGHSAMSTCMSECITELDVGSTAGPRKRLFSELGLEEILNSATNSSTITKSSSEDQFSSTERRKVEASSSNSNQVQWTKLPCSAGSISLVQAVHKQDTYNLLGKKDVPQSQVDLWIDNSYSINVEKAVAASPQKPEKPMKLSRKRARPGESTRPRPKDRQQIQDHLKELRGIIPNGAKCSIDCLLDLTIKHMLFLQSITQYADKIEEAEKLIVKENVVVSKDNSTGGYNGSGGATWACEIEGPTMSCPIIVEDLSTSQMLIGMLCEDRGFFLEIADMIRGFGLNIWKGVMERREDKIWARFIVEKNKNVQRVTRLDIIWSLVQLLQQTNTSSIDSMNQPNSSMDDRIPLLDSYHQPLLPIS